MKKKIIIIFVFLFGIFSAQINLKQVSFKQNDSITDIELYRKGLIKSIEKIKPLIDGIGKSVGLEKKEETDINIQKEVDNIYNLITKESIEKYSIIYHFEYIDNHILRYWKVENGEKKEFISYIYLDYLKGKEYYRYPKEDERGLTYSFKKIKNLSIKEEKNQKRKILGINCYKAIATYTEIEEAVNDPEFPEFNKPEECINIKLEMWVTQDIKTLYHPVLKVKEVLGNFYPLEINESNNFIEGSIRKYTLKEIVKM